MGTDKIFDIPEAKKYGDIYRILFLMHFCVCFVVR